MNDNTVKFLGDDRDELKEIEEGKLELTQEKFEEYLDEYIELTGQIKALEDRRKKIQSCIFERYFDEYGISEYPFYNVVLRRQARRVINYPDSDELKAFLQKKGVYELCVSYDKKKIDRLTKAKILDAKELEKYQEIKTIYAWVLEKVETLDTGDDSNGL